MKSFHFRDGSVRRMPIDSMNELPRIRFPIGVNENDASICCLYDTGAALNTGQLAYHRHIMETQPDLVLEYEAFDGENPFDPIKLYGAITDPSQYNENDHGILKAVIRYKTPFLNTVTNEPVTLSFALGDDVSVDTIMGLPSIEEFELELHFRPHKQLVSHSLERTFSVFNQETVSTIIQNDAQLSQPTTSVAV